VMKMTELYRRKLEKWRTTEGVYIKSGQKRNIDDAIQNLCQAEIILQNFSLNFSSFNLY
jgi:hypothetical protein